MPELPEVETVKKGLTPIINKKIINIFRSNKNLRFASSLNLEILKSSKIISINRRARYLIIDFNNKTSAVLHLGMSGKITIKNNFEKLKHDHFALNFSDSSWMIFNDTRRFGFIDLIYSKDLTKHKMLSRLGLEPLDENFNFKYLKEKLKNKSSNIKTTMMDNEIVVGVGNIYINESLFDAKISPLRAANSLSDLEAKKLINSIKKIIAKAIDLGGSSISDYVDTNGDLGYFQNNFKTYGRAKENCLQCKNTIERIVQNGRSSFFCNKCQK
jgi:formamidopyrimidine-DNA glycosylase